MNYDKEETILSWLVVVFAFMALTLFGVFGVWLTYNLFHGIGWW